MKREQVANKLLFLMTQMRELLPEDIIEALREAINIILTKEELRDD